MRCEIRRDGVGSGYEMIVTNADGSQRMERFEETGDLIKRTLEFQRELIHLTRMRRPVRIVAIQQITKPVKDGKLPSAIKAVIRVLDAQFHGGFPCCRSGCES